MPFKNRQSNINLFKEIRLNPRLWIFFAIFRAVAPLYSEIHVLLYFIAFYLNF